METRPSTPAEIMDRHGVTVGGCLQDALPVFEALTQDAGHGPARHLRAAFRQMSAMMDQVDADSFPVEDAAGDVFEVMERPSSGDVSRRMC